MKKLIMPIARSFTQWRQIFCGKYPFSEKRHFFQELSPNQPYFNQGQPWLDIDFDVYEGAEEYEEYEEYEDYID